MPIDKDKTWVHMGHTIKEIQHPKTPKGHQAYEVTNPKGVKDIQFSPSVKSIGDQITLQSRSKLKMSVDIDKLETLLLKARKAVRLAEEPQEDEEDVSPEEAGGREFDPDEEEERHTEEKRKLEANEPEEDEADKWLKEFKPEDEEEESEPEDEEEESEDEPEEYDEFK